MPSTRRTFLTATVMVTAGCAGQQSGPDARKNETDTPDETTTTPPTSESDDAPAFVHWSREMPHDELGLVSLGGGPETPAIFVGSAASDDESTDADHALHALSLQEGNEKWRVNVPNPVQSLPRYAGTEETPRIVFSTGLKSLHGKAFAVQSVDPDSGERLWQFDIDDRRFLYPIVTTEETVIVGRRDDQLAESGEHVYALDVSNGDERWRTETGDVSENGNARRGDTLFVKTFRHVRAYNIEDGDERWQTKAETVRYDNRGERVFVEADDTVRALKRTDGTELWHREFDNGISGIVTPREAMDETVFVGDSDGQLLALSPLDGETRWTLSIGSDKFWPSVERTSEQLFVAGSGVHAVDPVSGERQWSFTPDVEGYVNVDASQTVFARTKQHLWALDPKTGEKRWKFSPGNQFEGVASAGNFAFVGVNRTVYALDGSEST